MSTAAIVAAYRATHTVPAKPRNEVYETLVAAKKLIRRKKNWTKGKTIRITYDGTVSYCALGAVDEAARWKPAGVGLGAIARLKQQAGREVFLFNDHPDTTHRDVIRLFNRAIRAEKKKGLI